LGLRCLPGLDGPLIIATEEETSPTTDPKVCGNSLGYLLGYKININTAGLEELNLLPGIGPMTAEKILAERNKKTEIKSIDYWETIPGISKPARESLQKWTEIK